jgi:hypothetical protein
LIHSNRHRINRNEQECAAAYASQESTIAKQVGRTNGFCWLQTSVPSDYDNDLPQVKGRATVEMIFSQENNQTRFQQNQLPNVEHFMRVSQINHDGTIDMLACHINQLVGSTSGFGMFTASVLTDKDQVTH